MKKEHISALMDGETLDNEVISAVSRDAQLQQCWARYHLIGDILREEISPALPTDLPARIAAAIAAEPLNGITEAQPEPARPPALSFWRKLKPWAAQLGQVAVAASVALIAIVGVQYYHQTPSADDAYSEAPVFNTLPLMGRTSPVSLGVPVSDNAISNSQTRLLQEQRRRLNAILQDYELQRRLNADPALPADPLMSAPRYSTDLRLSDDPALTQ